MAFAFCSSQNMQLSICILFMLCVVTVKSKTVLMEVFYITAGPLRPLPVSLQPLLQLVATPDYPVVAGQTVNLHCSSFLTGFFNFTWERWENQTWQTVSSDRDLTLTEPEQSGYYRCRSRLSSVSPQHMVSIIPVHETEAGEGLKLPAFLLSIVALIIALAALLWMVSERLCNRLCISKPVSKGFPDLEKSPKGGLPTYDNEGDVYMNYTGTNPAYTDLDPTKMTDNVYASL